MNRKFLLLCLTLFIILKTNASTFDFTTDFADMPLDTPCTADLGTGDGKDGAANSLSNIFSGNYTLDGKGNFISAGNVIVMMTSIGNNVLNFNNFTLSAGDTLSFNEIFPQGPVKLNCTGKATITGVIDLRGKRGGTGIANGCQCSATIAGGAVGAGGPGGGTAGGKGAAASFTGGVNNGLQGVSYGSSTGGGYGGKKGGQLGGGGGGGGGASYGLLGNTGGTGSKGDFGYGGGTGGSFGDTYGDPDLITIDMGTNLLGGSGGGGGGSASGNPDVTTGGGGGGGGGGVQLAAQSVDLTGGLITVAGGDGGTGAAGCPSCSAHQGSYAAGGGGGGGSGGTISILYIDTCMACSTGVSIYGGATGAGGVAVDGKYGGSGGYGGDGRFLLTQICSLTTAVNEKEADNGTVYPNPASSTILFTFHSAQNALMKLYDVTGRELNNISFSEKQLTIDRGSLLPGIYIYKYITNGKTTGAGKIILL